MISLICKIYSKQENKQTNHDHRYREHSGGCQIGEMYEVSKGKKKKKKLILRNLFETTALWLILMNTK